MKTKTKCILLNVSFRPLLFALLLVLSSVSSLLTSPHANAYAPTASPPWTSDLEAKLDATFAGTSVENWRELNYATGDYNGSSFLFFVADDSHFTIGDDGSSTSLYGKLCRWDYGLSSPGCNNLNNEYGLSVPTLYTLHFSETFATNQPTQYAAAHDEYEDLLTAPGNPLDPDNSSTPRCQPWDIPCWFSATLGAVVDSFQSLADFFGSIIQGLGEWIANLIMPSNADGGFDNRFTDFFTSMDDTLHERLGILLFPFDFIAQFFESIFAYYNPTGSDSGACISGTDLTIPNLLGSSDVTFSLCGFATKLPDVWTVMQGIANIAWVIVLIGFLHQKYFSVVKGDEA